MKRILALVLACLLPLGALAEDAPSSGPVAMIRPAGDSDLSEFLWINRPIIVFADTPADPRYAEQIAKLTDDMEMLVDRDVVILTDTDPSAESPLRERFRPRGFMLVLVGKDGTIIARNPFPRSVREISRSIDKMPLRQQEVRDRRGGEG